MSRLAPAAPPPPSVAIADTSQCEDHISNADNDRKFAVTSQDDHTSDLSSESSATSSNTEGTGSSNLYASFGKYQDSDNDSGIVTSNHHGNRIGSTSSADTDVSQLGNSSKSVSSKTTFDEGYSSLKTSSEKNIPINGNHSILIKEKFVNPQRLSLPIDCQLVRFEDDLQLSEQNVRRSCRKLFAALYAQQDMARNGLAPLQPVRIATSNQPVDTLQRKTNTSHKKSLSKRHNQRHSMLEHSPTEDVDIVKVYARPASVIPDPDFLGLMECPRDINGNTKSVPERNMFSLTINTGTISNEPLSVVGDIGSGVPGYFSGHTGPALSTKSWDLIGDRSSYVDRNVIYSDTKDRITARVPGVDDLGNALPPLDLFVDQNNILPNEVSTALGSITHPKSLESTQTVAEVGQTDSRLIVRPIKQQQHYRERSSSLNENRHRDCAVFKVKAKVLAKSGSSTMPKFQTKSEETVPKALMASEAQGKVNKRPPNVLELGLLTQRNAEGQIIGTTQSLWKDRPLVNSQPCLTFTLPRSNSNLFTATTNTPKKNLHKSDFALYQGPSPRLSPCPSPAPSPAPAELGRSRSFLDRMQDMSRTARSAIQRAFSQERIYRPEQEERMEATGRTRKASGTFVQGIKEKVGRRRRKDERNNTEVCVRVERTVHGPDPWGQDETDCDQVWGQLLQLNVDGSQVVELSRPHGKPFGFFVARGRVKNSRGVFVSRMRDVSTQKMFSGLLEVGDEILEIDGVSVKDCDILEVNVMMGKKLSLLITVLPYHCRKDI